MFRRRPTAGSGDGRSGTADTDPVGLSKAHPSLKPTGFRLEPRAIRAKAGPCRRLAGAILEEEILRLPIACLSGPCIRFLTDLESVNFSARRPITIYEMRSSY
jgi:hypothetical protein